MSIIRHAIVFHSTSTSESECGRGVTQLRLSCPFLSRVGSSHWSYIVSSMFSLFYSSHPLLCRERLIVIVIITGATGRLPFKNKAFMMTPMESAHSLM